MWTLLLRFTLLIHLRSNIHTAEHLTLNVDNSQSTVPRISCDMHYYESNPTMGRFWNWTYIHLSREFRFTLIIHNLWWFGVVMIRCGADVWWKIRERLVRVGEETTLSNCGIKADQYNLNDWSFIHNPLQPSAVSAASIYCAGC